MNCHAKEFLKRGLLAAWGGPVILAVVYGILGAAGTAEALQPAEVCRGILSLTLMTFVAAGITAVYQIERLPTLYAALIHAAVLYADYLLIYLVNGWIPREGIWLFTGIFAAGFALVWVIVALSIRAKTRKMNTKLCNKEQ